jgi:hypothetical protein
MLIYLKNAYWQGKQVLILTYYYNYKILVFKRWRNWTCVNNKNYSPGFILHV